MGALAENLTARDTVVAALRKRLGKWCPQGSISMFFLGFSAGLPLLLIFSTLSLWLREAGVSRSAVTFFSWAALAYSFKFLWAPLVDLLPLPVFTRLLGRRRGWLCLAQTGAVLSIVMMALVDPSASFGEGGNVSLVFMSLATVSLGFFSATQDTVIDAYRIECAAERYQALLASIYIAGYRVGMLLSGAGSLFLAQMLGTSAETYSYSAWRLTYLVMALFMATGIITTLIIQEPQHDGGKESYTYPGREYLRLFALFFCCAAVFGISFFYGGAWLVSLKEAVSSNIAGFFLEGGRLVVSLVCTVFVAWSFSALGLVDRHMVRRSYIEPVADFFSRYGVKSAVIILLLISCYRFSDIVLGVISNVFYLDLGFSKADIAVVSKTFGLIMGLLGGFVGGWLGIRYGVYIVLMLGALLSSVTNILFLLLTDTAADVTLLAVVIGADNLAAGVAGAAFIAFLSSLTSYSFTAVQYAVFSSMMTLMPKLIGGYSGTIVAASGYNTFFLFTAAAGIPVMGLIWLVWQKTKRSSVEQQGRDI